ncbi:UNVERIFIED_CONTAM: hypothetical protein FKN15_046908 [Acipenser sinensis]
MPMRKPHNRIQNGDTSLDKDSLHYRDTALEQKLANDGEHELLDDLEVNDSPLMNGIGSTLSNGGISLHSAVKRKLVEDKDYVFDKRLRYNVRQNESNCRFRDIVVRKEEGFTHILLSSQTSDNNALTPEIMTEVRRALGNASVDDSKLLLLSAVGSVFCSGLDYSYLIGRLSSDRRKESTRIAESIRDFVKAFIQFKKPIVVAINGPALGLGASILPLCDIVWASEKAWFQTPCATIRLTPAGCSSYTFPQILGVALRSPLYPRHRDMHHQCTVITSKAINGPALGLGASILPLCDIVWASEKAWFQTPCATIRLTPAGCSSYTFPQILGVALVLEESKYLVRSFLKPALEGVNEKECQMLKQLWSSSKGLDSLFSYLQDDALVLNVTEFSQNFKVNLKDLLRHVSIGMKKCEDDAIWIRVAWGDNFTEPNQFKPTYVVYQLQTPYVFISSLNVKHRPLLSQALVIATKHDEIKEIQLKGRCLKSLKDLVLRRYKQPWEMIKPSITELTKEVRTNILCTVEGCGKILPNTPALNMHLVKSHRIQDGMVNPTVLKKKDIKASQKLYCCPMEGCPRGPNRPFSQFSLVKQHFMKMHTEKKYKCAKCSNSYSTEWDLKRHSEDCGKMYQCTCGCPYACRAALLSHIYRTGHEIPAEHSYPPVKKRKMEGSLGGAPKQKPNKQMFQIVSIEQELSEVYVVPSGPCQSNVGNQNSTPTKTIQKLLLPKPRVALVKVPVMQFAHVPIIVSSAEHSIKPVVVAVDNQGSVISTVHLLPQSMGTLDTKALTFRDTMPMSRLALGPVSTGVQVNLEAMASNHNILAEMGHRNKSISTNIQTDISYLSKGSTPAISCPVNDSSVSSCAQTDISVSAQVLLPINVQTQTFPSPYKMTSSTGAQTDTFGQTYYPSYAVTRETQTSTNLSTTECREQQMDQAIMCTDIFENDSSYSVSTQTSLKSNCLTENVDQYLTSSSNPSLFDEKSVDVMCFSAQTSLLPQHPVADNQTQTMNLFSDLENILSDSITGHSLDNHGPLSDASTRCEVGLTSVQEQNTGIDFDFEEFLNAAHTQTQTEESELGTLNSEPALESLDIETQTDFLFYDDHAPNYSNRVQSNYLGLDTQTQTHLNFLMTTSSNIPLGNFLKQSSFSMSMESSDTETQTEVHPALWCNPSHESQVKSNSTETQTITSCFGSLGNLFLTSNETQTVMGDFLVADVAWNTLESHFSSVETQTCEELSSLFHHSDKTNNLI